MAIDTTVGSPLPPGGPPPRDADEERESWVGDSQIAYSCGRNSNGDASAINMDGNQQRLDFYFLYKVDLGVGGILDTRQLEISYTFNLASKLLLCTRDDTSMSEELLPAILEVDSAQPDTFLELGKSTCLSLLFY